MTKVKEKIRMKGSKRKQEKDERKDFVKEIHSVVYGSKNGSIETSYDFYMGIFNVSYLEVSTKQAL